MRIAVLHPSPAGSSSPFVAWDPEADPSPHRPDHEWTHLRLLKTTAVAQVLAAERQGFDAFLNLCDGAWAEDRAGIEVVIALERLGAAFTGAGSACFEPSRLAMKMAAGSVGVGIPGFVEARSAADAERAARSLRFPLIVKHPNGYSSVGLTPRSRVTSTQDLLREVAAGIEAFGAALIEEFVDGREATVLVAEPTTPGEPPRTWDPVEFRFPPGESFKHFDLKWKDHARMTTVPVGDAGLRQRLREAAAATFEALGASGYARCDFRVDAAGRIWFLEINPNCGVFYPPGSYGSADLILDASPGGHAAFLDHILAGALRRAEAARPAWRIEHRGARGFGLVAARDLTAGERVIRNEETPHRLVSRDHVARSWTPRHRDLFDRYAWPIGPGVFAIWSEDPERWCPIDHSCDPSAWLDGLDVVARKDLRAGEPITLDYATFCGPEMAAFDCSCSSPDCRGRVLGTDSDLPALRDRYRGHLSPFLQGDG